MVALRPCRTCIWGGSKRLRQLQKKVFSALKLVVDLTASVILAVSSYLLIVWVLSPLVVGIAMRLITLFSPFDGFTDLFHPLHTLGIDWVLGFVLQGTYIAGSGRVKAWLRLYNRNVPPTEEAGVVLMRSAMDAISHKRWQAAEESLDELYRTCAKPCISMCTYVGGVLLAFLGLGLVLMLVRVFILQDGTIEYGILKLNHDVVSRCFVHYMYTYVLTIVF